MINDPYEELHIGNTPRPISGRCISHCRLYYAGCHKLTSIILGVYVVPESSEVLLAAEFVELLLVSHGFSQMLGMRTCLLNLLGRELECHGPQVVRKPLLFAARRDGNHILVDAPSQTDLAWAHGILLRETVQKVVGRSTLAFGYWSLWTVGGSGDTLLSVVLEQICVLQVRMELNLVDGGWDRAVFQNEVEVIR